VADKAPGAAAPGALRRALDVLYLASGILAALCLCGVCTLMLLQVLFREMSLLLRGADDLTAWGCASMAFLGLAYTFKQGDIIRMGIVIERFGGRSRRVMEAIALAVAAAFAGYLAWWMLMVILEHIEFNDMAQGLLLIPIWIPKTTAFAGAAILFVAIIDELVMLLRGATPSYMRMAEQRLAERDFSDHL
jgi:TRAP-type C4-dicarboxylate transport system permease small subunit